MSIKVWYCIGLSMPSAPEGSQAQFAMAMETFNVKMIKKNDPSQAKSPVEC